MLHALLGRGERSTAKLERERLELRCFRETGWSTARPVWRSSSLSPRAPRAAASRLRTWCCMRSERRCETVPLCKMSGCGLPASGWLGSSSHRIACPAGCCQRGGPAYRIHPDSRCPKSNASGWSSSARMSADSTTRGPWQLKYLVAVGDEYTPGAHGGQLRPLRPPSRVTAGSCGRFDFLGGTVDGVTQEVSGVP